MVPRQVPTQKVPTPPVPGSSMAMHVTDTGSISLSLPSKMVRLTATDAVVLLFPRGSRARYLRSTEPPMQTQPDVRTMRASELIYTVGASERKDPSQVVGVAVNSHGNPVHVRKSTSLNSFNLRGNPRNLRGLHGEAIRLTHPNTHWYTPWWAKSLSIILGALFFILCTYI